MRTILPLCGLALVAAPPALADLLIGHDTQQPVKQYTTSGTFVTNWGVANQNATGSAIDGSGNVVTCNPNFGANQLETLSAPATSLGTVTAAVSGNFIEDMGSYSATQALAGTFEGNVFLVDYATGNSTLLFNTGHSYIGVSSDGSNLWTTGGLTNNNAYYRDLAGNVLFSFSTGGSAAGGIAYDPTDSTLYIGDFGGTVRHFTTTGTLLGSFTTGFGTYIDGIETDYFIPEPASLTMLALAGALIVRRR